MNIEIQWTDNKSKNNTLWGHSGVCGDYRFSIKDCSTSIDLWLIYISVVDECIFDSRLTEITATGGDAAKELCQMILEMDLGIPDPIKYFNTWKRLSQ